MNRIISITIAGTVFQIEEEAYAELERYLNNVNRHFRGTPGGTEIINDIEARVAEMLQAKLQGPKTAITTADVREIIAIMGQPSDFADEGEEAAAGAEYEEPVYVHPKRNRLYRDPDDRVLGGVSSGIAHKMDIDPIWIRLAWVLLVVFGVGSGLIIYIVLWLIMPAAETPAQRLEMYGEPVNISNIERSVRKEYEGVKKKFGEVGSEAQGRAREGVVRSRSFFQRLGTVLEELVRIAVKVIVFFALAMVILVGLSVLVSLIGALIGVAWASLFSFPEVYPLFFEKSWPGILGTIGVLLVLGVPAAFLIYGGFRLLLKPKGSWKAPVGTMAGLWVLGFIFIIAVTSEVMTEFSTQGEVVETETFPMTSDTLFIAVPEAEWEKLEAQNHTMLRLGSFGNVMFDDEHLLLNAVTLEVQDSPDSLMHVQVVRKARGGDTQEAEARAGAIPYPIQKQDSLLLLSGIVQRGQERWRNQQVELVVKVPAGKVVSFAPSANVLGAEDDHFQGGYDYRVNPIGLNCINCSDTAWNRYLVIFPLEMSEPLRALEVEDAVEVTIMPSQDSVVRLHAFREVQGSLGMESRSGRLKLESSHFVNQHGALRLEVPEDMLQEIEVQDHAQVNFLAAANILSVKVEDGATFTGKISGSRLVLDISDYADAELSGDLEELDVRMDDGADLQASTLRVQRANMVLKDRATAAVHVLEQLDGRVADAAEITYHGKPHVQRQISESGRIKVAEGP